MTITKNIISHNRARNVKNTLQNSSELPFIDMIPDNLFEKHFSEVDQRQRIYTAKRTLYGLLTQAIHVDHSCQNAVIKLQTSSINKRFLVTPSANTAAYSKARLRLPEEGLKSLTKEAAYIIDSKAPESILWRTRNVKLIDGSTLTMEDTPENQSVYPQPNSQKKGSVSQQ